MTGHRRLVHRHRQRILSGEPRELGPGEARLYSYYAPSLTGGLHQIKVTQDLEAPADPNDPTTITQSDTVPSGEHCFIVVAPRFSLKSDAVESIFPAPGTQAEHTILPHIIRKDPHLSWNRSPSHIPEGEDSGTNRSRTTWLALMVFSPDELRLSDAEMDSIAGHIPPDVKREQTDSFSLRLLARDTPSLRDAVNTTAFYAILDARDAAETTDVVFLRGRLFTALFSKPDVRGPKLNVASYKYMAHVRKFATDGMANSGSEADEQMVSTVVSRRTGLIEADTPSSLVVHLLSLVWDTKMPLPGPDDRVAMTSLYSWTYTCLPSKNQASTLQRLTNLGRGLNVLRTDSSNSVPKQTNSDDQQGVADVVQAREADGYTITRNRTVTGELGVCVVRGPLVPRYVKRLPRDKFSMQSNYGSDLAIFDPALGLLDTTYSNAWQLGKTLAMADEPFCAALVRLPNTVHGAGLNGAKQEMHNLLGGAGHGPRSEAADSMVDLVRGLNLVNAKLHVQGRSAAALAKHRSQPTCQPVSTLMRKRPLKLAMADNGRGSCGGDDSPVLYNEYNIPASPDYARIYSWVLDKVHLANVPAHYLIPDPSFLPQESLRFFFIDANWIDALIDGALSLANHWGDAPEHDFARTAIKGALNQALRAKDKSLGGWHVQMPRYGFIMRSQILAEFPDLAVEVRFSETRKQPLDPEVVLPANTPPDQPILVQKSLAPDTMYCLFDAAPPDLRRIKLTMPPHQQCFKVGETLTKAELLVSWRKLYTTSERSPTAQPGDTLGNEPFTPGNADQPPLFDWDLRTLDPEAFARKLITVEGEGREEEFWDKEPSLAVLGLQLNDSILELDIGDISALQYGAGDGDMFQLLTPSDAGVPIIPALNLFLKKNEGAASSGRKVPCYQAPSVPSEALCQEGPTDNSFIPSPVRLSVATPPLDPSHVTPPDFTLSVYWVASKTRKFIPTCFNLPIDLVFSLTKSGPAYALTPLTRILVAVPAGKMPPSAGTDPNAFIPLLSPTADPPVPKMLNNMRLNVLKRWGDQDDPNLNRHVIFELIPRQQPGVLVQMLQDASFRVPRAKIVTYNGPHILFATVRILYEYLDPDGVPRFSDYENKASVQLRSSV